MKQSPRRRGAQPPYTPSTPASTQLPDVAISRLDMLALLRETVATQPDAVAGLLAAMRAGARRADAELLLDVIVEAGPAQCGRIAATLWASGAGNDLDHLLDRLGSLALLDFVA